MYALYLLIYGRLLLLIFFSARISLHAFGRYTFLRDR